ncbi:MAG: hypothetical protein AAB602_00200 [Patescibacteria group bacterium]
MNTEQEIKICGQCKNQFTIEPDDFGFYEKFGVPPPQMCPLCRAQRRLAFRNERVFYKRPCDKCKKDVVSMYSPNKPYPVWCYECWFADDWDATEYGQNYDPVRPILKQINEVYMKVPKVALIYVRSVNSEYVNISADNKNCYMLVESSNNEGCVHSYWVQQCRDSIDLSFSHQTELAYESDDCYNCYRLFYSRGCHDSRDSYFLNDCRGCSDCIGCINLRNQQYCVFNKPLGREAYKKFFADARLDTASGVEAMRKKFEEFIKAQPRRYAEIINAPGSSGNYINDAKNCRKCFHSYDAEDCAYGEHVWRNAKDCMDVSTAGRNAQMIYNSINTGIDVSNHICVAQGWSSTFLEYSFNCFNSNHCFGSAGLRKKDYCILNKQYSREEYESLRKKIIDEMKAKGDYGEFFPISISLFGYNETVAQEQFPLAKEEALKRGFKWEDHPRGTYGKETISWDKVPDSIKDFAPAEVSREIFVCTACEKNYRIISDEFNFYKKLGVPLPRLCPDCRHARRFTARGPNRLWKRQCLCNSVTGDTRPAGGETRQGRQVTSKYQNTATHFHGDEPCPNEFETNFSPERKEILYCGQCYSAETI